MHAREFRQDAVPPLVSISYTPANMSSKTSSAFGSVAARASAAITMEFGSIRGSLYSRKSKNIFDSDAGNR